MILTVSALITGIVLYSVTAILDEAFHDNWLNLEETAELTERQKLERENEEYDWGHNIKNYRREEE